MQPAHNIKLHTYCIQILNLNVVKIELLTLQNDVFFCPFINLNTINHISTSQTCIINGYPLAFWQASIAGKWKSYHGHLNNFTDFSTVAEALWSLWETAVLWMLFCKWPHFLFLTWTMIIMSILLLLWQRSWQPGNCYFQRFRSTHEVGLWAIFWTLNFVMMYFVQNKGF